MNKYFLIILFIMTNATAAIGEPNPCDPQKEIEREKINKACSLKKPKSEKTWSNLESAKIAIMEALKSGDSGSLAPYIGCDASDSSKHEVICESHSPVIGEGHIKEVMKKVKSSSKSVLQKIKWVNYGISKDLFLLCSEDLKTKVHQNYCGDDKRFQPIVEIREIDKSYYIFGVPLAD